MKYDFENVINRANTGSMKWDQMKGWNPDVSESIVPFSVADMELKNAPEIIDGVCNYLKNSVLGYTGPTESYFKAVCGWMKRRFDYEVDPSWVVIYPGVVPAFFNAVRAYTKPGEGVILMTPVYYPFYMAMDLNDRKIARNKLIKTEDSYEVDYADLEEKAKDPNNKVLLFCSPHNPVGKVWTREELEKIGEICLRNNVLIISDEIHNDLVMKHVKHTVFATLSEELADHMIVCTAPSKTFNLAGMATSNIIIKNKELRDAFRAEALRAGVMMTNCVGLKACEIAYNECEDWLEQLLDLIQHNHEELKKYLALHLPEVKVYDLEGTYLQWMDFSSFKMSKEELEKFMHIDAQVFFDEGYVFGEEGDGFERMNLACPTKTMMDALERIVVAYKKP